VDLQPGDVAVVTGAASGIGRGIAEAFAQRGLSVVLADVEVGALAEATAATAALGVPTLGVPTDVSDRAQVQALHDHALERFGTIDVVCNNAGVTTPTRAVWEMDELDWRWVLGVNLWGVINGIGVFVPGMVERGRGHVVNTASIMGLGSWPMSGPYTASKHAVVALSETLRTELARRAPGVGVTVLCPSFVPTRIGDAARNRPADLTPQGAGSQGGTRDWNAHEPVLPLAVGQMVVSAVSSGRFYLTTHPGQGALVRQRMEAILAEVDG
jgi:NAD(P)-dependent dehydrogenase (short-subunit alcohol dehydrogenase family)